MTSRLLAGVLSGPWTVPGELGVDADQPGLVVDVGPGEAERFADPQAGVGEELEQWPLRAPAAARKRASSSPSRIEARLGVQRGFSPGSRRATNSRTTLPHCALELRVNTWARIDPVQNEPRVHCRTRARVNPRLNFDL